MTWTFHEHERFPGFGWIEPIMSPGGHLLDRAIGEHIVEQHNRDIEQEPYLWPNP